MKLLKQIREGCPPDKDEDKDEYEDFGFPTSDQRIIGNGSGTSTVEIMALRRDYYETFKAIVKDYCGTELGSLGEDQYTGEEDPSTVRVRPYTFVLVREGVILADCFVRNNSLFIIDVETLKRNGSFGITAEMGFREIAKILNGQLKSELLEAEGIKRIEHREGYKGKILAEIQKILKNPGNITSSSTEGSGGLTEELTGSEREKRLTEEQWLELFTRYSKDKNNWDKNGKVIQPTRYSKGPVEGKMAQKLAQERLKEKGGSTEFRNELTRLGFDLKKQVEILTDDEWLELFAKWREENPGSIQPSKGKDKDRLEFRLAKKLDGLRRLIATQGSLKLRQDLIELGFITEKLYKKPTYNKWLEVCTEWRKANPERQPSKNPNNGNEEEKNIERQIYAKICNLRRNSQKTEESIKLGLELRGLGFNV
jgi:hypothetical protein